MITRKHRFEIASTFGAAVLLCMTAAPALAQRTARTAPPPPTVEEPDRWNITGFLGPGFGGGLQGNVLDLGAAVGYNWTDRLGFEGEFSFGRQGNQGLLNVSSNTETFSGNVLYHIPYRGWLPYGTFGLGAVHGGAAVTLNGQPGELSQSNTDFAWNIGAGVKKRLSENLRFRGDLRFFDTGANLPNFWRVYGGLTFLLARR